ncbi:putative Short chain dehydrogenase [Fasciola hepatica]|uniref:Short chain dehydrogenase n=1 Tax=Fasciola hepatica TaxID=6192 RepID=A0A4E0RUI2_FASHE|nr:putative Short chain dehydrogenase [Fasciola hepatica]
MSWLLLLVAAVLIVLLWLIKKVHFDHKDCLLPQRLDHKRVVVTGCNQGIGYETVGELARRGACVIMACRDLRKCESARRTLLERFGKKAPHSEDSKGLNLTPITEEQLICEQLDLASARSVHAFAERMIHQGHPIDILINNAGIDFPRPEFGADGIELHVRVNHLGHFLLTNLLKPILMASNAPRIIVLSSLLHRLAEVNVNDLCRPLVGSPYANSKLLNVIHARQLMERWTDHADERNSGCHVLAVSVHPGLVMTQIFQHSPFRLWLVHKCLSWLAKTPWQGSQTVVYCSLANNLVPGAYYAECRVTKTNPQALDGKVGQAVWDASEQLVKRWEASEL